MTMRANRQAFLNEAEKHIGYQARMNKGSTYGELVGHPDRDWNGSFIDVIARTVGLNLPSHVHTAAALSYYFQRGMTHVRPKPGDIVFFSFSHGDPQGMPHVGIVTDVEHFSKHGMFQVIEAQTSNGTPKGSAANDGVYRRNRYVYEVLAFARPNFKRTFPKKQDAAAHPDPGKLPTKPSVKSSIIIPGLKHPCIITVQLALGMTVGLRGAKRGEWDHKTAAAFANFQRRIGYIGSSVNGIPDFPSLERLSLETGNFFITIP
jgi:hypothetical protein